MPALIPHYVTIYFSNETVQTDVINDSFRYTEIYYNDLKPADNTVTLKVPFTLISAHPEITLADKLIAERNRDIKVAIQATNGQNYFTGYLRKSFTIEKKQRHQPLSLEIVSPSYLLKRPIGLVPVLNTPYLQKNMTVSQVLNGIAANTGFEIETTINITTVLPIFQAHEDEEIYTIISDLLFEFGYTFDFNSNGKMVLYPLFNKPVGTISQVFNGYTIREKVSYKVDEDKYTRVATKWTRVEYMHNIVLYENIEGRNEAHKDGCQIIVQPKSYIFNNHINTIPYDSSLGTVIWVDTITPSIALDSTDLTVQLIENHGTYAHLSIYNTSSQNGYYVNKLTIRGDAYIESEKNTGNAAYSTGKIRTFDIKYNHNEYAIKQLTQDIQDYYKYASFNVVLKSDVDYPLGSFVIITETAMGQVIGRIIQKKHTYEGICVEVNPIEYTIESITEYNPTEDIEMLYKPSSKMASLLAVPPDLEAPTVPVLVATTAQDDGSIEITFNKSTDTLSGVNYYNIYRRESPTGMTNPDSFDYPTCLISIQHDKEKADYTFVDHATANKIHYQYTVTATDKANNESDASIVKQVQATVRNAPKSPYAIRCEALASGVDLLIFILASQIENFSNSINATMFFRLQVSLDNGGEWSDIGRIQGNSYLWSWPSSFTISLENLSNLKFRAFSSNMYNVENPTPIPMMHNTIKFDLAALPPPFKPDDTLCTQKIRDTDGSFSLEKGWYKVVLKGAGGGGGGGGKGGQSTKFPVGVIFGLPVPGKTGSSGASGSEGKPGGDSFFIASELGLKYIAYGGKGGNGGDGGDGGGSGLVWHSGLYGDDGENGQDGGSLSVLFWIEKRTDCTLKKGTGGAAGEKGT